MFTIRVQAGSTIRKLNELSRALSLGMGALTPQEAQKVNVAVARADKARFLVAQKRWPRVTSSAGIFSRVRFHKTGEMKTTAQVAAWARRLAPLMDTLQLFYMVTRVESPFRQLRLTSRSLTILYLLPYTAKHLFGGRENFQFGVVERGRLIRRVPPPRTRERAGRGVTRGDRVYYRILTNAKRSYPRNSIVPKRSWIALGIPQDVIELMAKGILNAFARRASLRSRGFLPRSAFPGFSAPSEI